MSEGLMSDLRTKLIKLAHEKPELRAHLLPMIKDASQSPRETAKWSVSTLEEALAQMEAVMLTLEARGGSRDYEADASLADTYGDAQKAVTLIRKASAPLAMATKLLKRVK
jgi:hypothetical protein